MKLSKLTTGAAAFALLSFTSVSAWALPVLTFTQTPNSGTFSYDGQGGPAVGNGIGFSLITLTGGTPPGTNSSVLDCTSCFLSFETGNNLTEGSGVNATYTFEDGGSFELTGTASSGTFTTGPGSSELLGGGFTGTPTITITGPSSGEFEGIGTNSVASDILTYFGIGASSFTFDYDLAGTATGGSDRSLSNGQVAGGSLTVTAVPEPAQIAMFLFGAGLIGGGLWLRRKPQVVHNAV
jgi:hypothetical protein